VLVFHSGSFLSGFFLFRINWHLFKGRWVAGKAYVVKKWESTDQSAGDKVLCGGEIFARDEGKNHGV